MTLLLLGVGGAARQAQGEGAPLSLSLEAARSEVLVGEDVLLRVAHRIHRRLTMETVELNRYRTTIVVERIGGGGIFTLTGADHLRQLQRSGRDGPAMIGREFVAEAGDAWVADLSLADYTAPLPVGRYRIGLRYRWGSDAAQTVHTNRVRVSVVPASPGGR